MSNIQKWKIIKSQMVFENQWCQVRQDEVELPNGQIVDDFFVNVRQDFVVVLAVTQQQEVVLVRQYRHGVSQILLELPAGYPNTQTEDKITAARRELEEETGYVASEFIKLGTLYDNPVKDTNAMHLFIAPNAKLSGTQQLDLTEDIEVILVPQEEVLGKILSGEICVSGTIACLFLGLKFLGVMGNR